MGAFDLFTNADVSEAKEDVKSPAFSLTKVQAGVGALIAAVLGAVPASLKADEAVVIAAIAAGAAVMLGVFALAAVDLITRQRAAEAKLRWGGAKPAEAEFTALPDTEDLRLQIGPNADEYRVKVAEVDGDTVTLVAKGHGEIHTESFQRSSTK